MSHIDKEAAEVAVKLVDHIMVEIWNSEVEPDQLLEFLKVVGHYEAGEGTLWGIMDVAKNKRTDGRFYQLKAEVARAIIALQKHTDWYLTMHMAIQVAMDKGKSL